MESIKQENGWVLARNIGTINGNGLGNHEISRVRQIYSVWTGEKWVEQRFYAKTFSTKEEADDYLDTNWEILDQS